MQRNNPLYRYGYRWEVVNERGESQPDTGAVTKEEAEAQLLILVGG